MSSQFGCISKEYEVHTSGIEFWNWSYVHSLIRSQEEEKNYYFKNSIISHLILKETMVWLKFFIEVRRSLRRDKSNIICRPLLH
ncbi:unnamed protein product [Leptidea sinapis]|nr:unnamed protein product [Leptidea sinapis]